MRLNIPKNKLVRHAVWLIPLFLLLMSCTNLGYYWQSARGHMKIMSKREDIDDLLQNPDVDSKIKQKLALVKQIRAFASEQLQLPDNDSYSQYADIQRRYVVWNVFAAPEFSTKLKQWCFLFVGCVGYRGYYSEQDAKELAAQVRSGEKLDVYVGGSLAYSTLGWFDDPVLSTFINYPEASLAGLIFHELTHQMLYIKNDAAFNEGLANTVEIEGVKRWLHRHPNSGDLRRYERHKKLRSLFVDLLSETNRQLTQLYQQQIPEQQMRERKAAIIAGLRRRFEEKKHSEKDLRLYDTWFDKPINNAQLGSVSIYEDYVPAFQQLLLESKNDLREFYRRVKSISELEHERRDSQLKALAKQYAERTTGETALR